MSVSVKISTSMVDIIKKAMMVCERSKNWTNRIEKLELSPMSLIQLRQELNVPEELGSFNYFMGLEVVIKSNDNGFTVRVY